MEDKSSNVQSTLKKYLSEIVVIFLGISISFWFDEWRDDRKDREIEQKILQSLKENLVQDTMVLEGTLKMGEALISGIDKLVYLKQGPEMTDSVSIYIDMAASYTGININGTTYEETKQTGHTSLIQNDTLKKAILGHYTSLIPYVKEWCEVDKTHTMTQVIPEMSNYFSVVLDSMDLISNTQKIKFLKTPKLRYLLMTNLAYKKEAIKALNIANVNSKRLIARIDKALKK